MKIPNFPTMQKLNTAQLPNSFVFNTQYTVLDAGIATNWGCIDGTLAQGATGVDVTPSGADVTPIMYKEYVYTGAEFPIELSLEFAGLGIAGIVVMSFWSAGFAKSLQASKALQIKGKNVFRFVQSDFTTGNGMTWEETAYAVVFAIPSAGQTASFTMNHVYSAVSDNTAVLLSFDDGVDNMNTTVRTMLEEKHMRGTFYVVPDWIGNAGIMTLANMQSLYANGHDIANHGNAHMVATGQSAADIGADIQGFLDWADTNGMPRAKLHYAYPDGVYNANSDSALTTKGILTARTTLQGYNAGKANPKYLYIYYAGNTTTANDLQTAYTTAAALKCSLQIIIHSVVDEPTESYEVATAVLQAFINYLDTNKIKAMTISQWYSHIARAGYLE